MNIDELWLASIAVTTFSFAGMLIFGFANYKEAFKARFSPLNMFPYELSFHNRGKLIIIYRFFLYLFSAFSLTPALLMVSKYVAFPSFRIYLILITIFFLASALTFLALNIIQAKFVMLHTILATAYFALSALIAGSTAIFLINIHSDAKLLSLGIIEAALAFSSLLVMLNPRLRHWAELKATTNEDGTVSIERPRIFILAFSEWLILFIDFAVQIVFFLAYLWN